MSAHTLVVESSPPSAVSMTILPPDSLGASGGATNFSRSYPDGTVVTLTAPNATGRFRFQKWLKDGVPYESSLTTQVTMDANHTLRAMYAEVVPTFPSDLRIMPIGDSITFGYNGGNAGYRGPLYTLLSPLALNFRYIGTSVERPGTLPTQPINQRYHEGHSSYTIQDVCNNLDGFDNTRFLQYGGVDRNPNGGYWLTGGNGTGRVAVFPDVITLMVGTNDMATFPGVEGRLQALISKITTLRPNAKLLVAKITPIPGLSTDEAYNAIIPNVVANFQAAGKNVHLVDLNTNFPSNGLDPDGIHPNDTGFNWMANKWFEAIVAAYSPATIDRPFRISPVALPGQIEAEDFDRGGRGISYQDLSSANEGGQYRATEDVDIEATTDTNGDFQVFHTEAGEWLKYTVSVATAGGFTPRLRISNPTPGGEIFLEVDGLNVTNNVAIPDTAGLATWQTLTLPEIQLSAGEHVIRLVVVSTTPGDTAGSINWLSFTANAKTGPSARAGPDLNVIDLDGNGSEPVTLNASATVAGDSPSLSYSWSRGGVVIANGVNPTVNLPVGAQIVQLTVTDGNGLEASDEVLATVSAKSLMNGSFESGFTNWTTAGSMLIETAAPYTPTDGVKLATFNGGNQSPNGVISQSFATAVGGTYTLTFDAGVVAFNGNTQTIQATVNGIGSLLSQTINLTGLAGGSNRWVPQSFTFVADRGTSTVTFRDLSGSTTGLDMTLDNVRISGPPAFPVNTAPVATSDSYSTNESTPLVVPSAGLLANDIDSNGNPLAAVVNVRPVHGTLSLNLNGGFTYTPSPGYFGPDSFSYHATDGFLNSNIVTVSLTVIEVIPAPVAFGESYGTTEDIPLVVPARGVLSNDADLRSRPLTAVTDAQPAHGDVSLNPDGSFVYTPSPGFFGNDSFSYHANNGFVNSNAITVVLTVDEAIPPPVAVADAFTTNENTPLVVPGSGVLANDTDPRSRPLTATIEDGPGHGSIGMNANGGFVYVPDDSYFGTDSFSYRANNVRHASNVVTVSIVINEVIPPPVAFADSFSTSENTTLIIATGGLLANDMDRRSRPIDAWLDSSPSHGSLSLNQDGGFIYTPDTGYFGTDYFTYHARNGYLDSNIVTVSLNINETPPPPTALADFYQTDEDTPLFVAPRGVLSNDNDPRSRPLTAWIDEGPARGSIGLDANGGFVYIPSPDYFGPDSFTYFARNGKRSSEIVTVDLMINEVIPAPLAEADAYVTDENTALVVTSNGLLANDRDTRSRPLTAVVDILPVHGTLVLNSNGNFTYTPNDSFYGVDSFTYHARNGFVDSETVVVTLTVREVVPPPIAVVDSYTTFESTPLVVPAAGVLANDFDRRSRPITAVLDGGPSHGTLTLNPNGSFTYTPATGYYGPDAFSYRAHNGFLSSNPVNVSLNVQEVIPAPVALPDFYSTQESTALIVAARGLLTNDFDLRSRPLTAVINAAPIHGVLLPNSNGGFKYTPVSGYYGSDSFTYHATNGFVDSNIVTVSITINEVVPPPVAVADSYSTYENSVLTVQANNGLLANDSDPRSRPLTAAVNTLPGHGSLALNANGSFTYTPAGGYFGPDSFTYHARNGFLDSNVVTVNLTVNEVIPPPVAVPDVYSTDESTALVVAAAGVLGNDSDPRARPLIALVNSLPVHGTLVLNANGSFTYTPVGGYFGPDSFTYHARNGFLDSNVVTVSLTIREVVPPPIASPDSYSTSEGNALTVAAAGVLANDSDPRSRPLTAILNSGPSHGTLGLNANGSFTYTPAAAYFGPDSFSYHARNGFLDSNVVTVNLTVTEVIPPPVAVADSYAASESTPLTVAASGLLANDSDPRSRPLTAILDAGPSHGTLTLNANGSFAYTPTAGYFGPDSFTYHARNGFLNSGIVAVNLTVNEVIPPPVATADSYSTNENVALTIPAGGVLANDSDPRSRSLTAVLDDAPAHGTLALNPNGSFTYTPVGGYFGPDSFSYHARNGFLDSNVVTVNLTVTEVIPPPVAVADSYAASESTPLTVPAATGLLANDSDPRSRPLTAILDAGPSHGALTLNPNGGFSYTPTAGYFGPDSFTYHARNGFLNSGIVAVNLMVNEVIPPPVATADSYSTNENVALTIPAGGVLANDSDPRSRSLTAVLDASPAHGTLALNSNGSFTYTPAVGYFGTDSFSYHARNGFLDSNVVTVNLTVTEVIPPPVAVADSYATSESTTLTVAASGLLANDSDPRSRPLTAVLDVGPSHGTLTLNPNGGFSYTPTAGYYGTDTFTYHARNGFRDSNVVVTTITINEVVPPPVATADSYTTNESTPLLIPASGVLANDSDPRARPLTAVLDVGPTHGTLALNANGSFNYTPTSGYFGLDSFTYHARNGVLNSGIVTVNLTVNEIIPPPVAVADAYTTNESTPLTVSAAGVLANDSDLRSRPLTAVLDAGPSRGTLILNSNGSFNYTPTTGYFGADTFTYHARNGFLNSAIVTVNLTVKEVIPPPVASADSYSTAFGTVLSVPAAGVLANDTDPRGRPITAILSSAPAHGTLSLNPNGSFTYTPAANYSGADIFTYRANNGTLDSNIVTVNLTVSPFAFSGLVNGSFESGFTGWTATGNQFVHSAAPYIATDGTKLIGFNGADQTPNAVLSQTFATLPGDTYTLTFDLGVLAFNTNSQTMQVVATGSNSLLTRTIVVNGVGGGINRWYAQSFTFVANSPTTTLTFRDQSTSTLALDMTLDNVRVTGPPNGNTNTAPVASADSYSTSEGTNLIVYSPGVLSNDTDAQSQPLSAFLNTPPTHGSLNLNTSGSFTYIPDANYFGSDSFTYHANDGLLDSNIVTVNLTITEVIPPPVAVADSYSTLESTPLVIAAAGVLANDSDPRSRPLTAILGAGPVNGTLSLNANGSFTYTPTTGYVGADSFTYRANNGTLSSNFATVSLTVNEYIPPPVAVADSYSTNESTALVIAAAGVLTNDSDPRSRPLTAVLSSGPGHGTLSLNTNGSFTYTPTPGYFGADSFSYRANNGYFNSNLVSVGLTVNEVIPPPVAVADSYSTNEGTVLVVAATGVLANDSDPRSRPLTAVLSSAPGRGTLSLNANGSFTYTPTPGYFGADSFTYRANNGSLNSNMVTVSLTVNEVIPPPVAVADSYSTNESTALVVAAAGVLANDSDPRSRPLTAVLSIGPARGTLSLNANGSFTYTPATGYFGPDSFTYRANNGSVNSNLVTVGLTINEVIPPPVAVADSYSTNESTALVIAAAGVLANDSDPRSRPLTAVLGTGPARGTLSLNANGSFTYTPTAGYFGPDSFTYRANNGSVNSNLVTVGLTVNEVIPPPVAVADSYSTNESTALVIAAAGVLANDSDPRSRPLTAVLSIGPARGTLSLNTNGSFTYTPTASYFGPDSFTYRANNGSVNSNLVTVSLTVNEVIPPPVAVADSYSTNQSTALVVAAAGVLANDSDPRSRPLTAVLGTGPGHGTLSLNANGGFTYTPTTGYSGPDSFTYRANNGILDSNLVSVSITVNPIITGQLVNGSFESGFTGWTTSGNLFFTDSTAPYTPTDGNKLAGFNGANSTPNAVLSQTFTTVAGQSYILTFDAGVVSFNTNSQTLQVGVTGTGSLLSQTINIFGLGGGSVRWLPQSFTFVANSTSTTLTFRDQSTSTSGLDLVLDNVRISTNANTAPVAAGDSYSTNQNTALVIAAPGLLANDTDAQSQPLTAAINTGPSQGTLVLNANGGFTYTPANGYFGSDSFTYHANDGFLDSNITTVSLTVIETNTAPVATADSYSTNQNTALVVAAPGVLGNDTDAQSQALTASINTAPGNGTVTLNSNGGFTYTPANGYSGPDSFTYRANDGSLNSNIATVSLTVVPVTIVGLVNGSFESGFTGWTSTGNQTIQTATIYAPTNGTKLVSFNGANTTPNAVLSQSFATTPGQLCTLAFDAGVFAYNTNPQTLQVTVTGTNSLLAQTVTLFGNGLGTARWQAQSFTFVANSTTTTLTFRDQSATTAAIDLLLDNVRVTAAAAATAPLATNPAITQAPSGMGSLSLAGAPGDFTIRMTASQPGSYVLERSEDLSHWEFVTEKQVSQPGPIEFRDSGNAPAPQQANPRMFYRVGRQPGATY